MDTSVSKSMSLNLIWREAATTHSIITRSSSGSHWLVTQFLGFKLNLSINAQTINVSHDNIFGEILRERFVSLYFFRCIKLSWQQPDIGWNAQIWEVITLYVSWSSKVEVFIFCQWGVSWLSFYLSRFYQSNLSEIITGQPMERL